MAGERRLGKASEHTACNSQVVPSRRLRVFTPTHTDQGGTGVTLLPASENGDSPQCPRDRPNHVRKLAGEHEPALEHGVLVQHETPARATPPGEQAIALWCMRPLRTPSR